MYTPWSNSINVHILSVDSTVRIFTLYGRMNSTELLHSRSPSELVTKFWRFNFLFSSAVLPVHVHHFPPQKILCFFSWTKCLYIQNQLFGYIKNKAWGRYNFFKIVTKLVQPFKITRSIKRISAIKHFIGNTCIRINCFGNHGNQFLFPSGMEIWGMYYWSLSRSNGNPPFVLSRMNFPTTVGLFLSQTYLPMEYYLLKI